MIYCKNQWPNINWPNSSPDIPSAYMCGLEKVIEYFLSQFSLLQNHVLDMEQGERGRDVILMLAAKDI